MLQALGPMSDVSAGYALKLESADFVTLLLDLLLETSVVHELHAARTSLCGGSVWSSQLRVRTIEGSEAA